MDVEGGQEDSQSQSLLADLRDSLVPRKLDSENLYNDEITWDGDKGVNPEDYDHARWYWGKGGRGVIDLVDNI